MAGVLHFSSRCQVCIRKSPQPPATCMRAIHPFVNDFTHSFYMQISSEVSVVVSHVRVFVSYRPVLCRVYYEMMPSSQKHVENLLTAMFFWQGMFISRALSCQSHMPVRIILKRLGLKCRRRRSHREIKTTPLFYPTVAVLGTESRADVPSATIWNNVSQCTLKTFHAGHSQTGFLVMEKL